MQNIKDKAEITKNQPNNVANSRQSREADIIAQMKEASKRLNNLMPQTETGHFEKVDAGNGAITNKWVIDTPAKGNEEEI